MSTAAELLSSLRQYVQREAKAQAEALSKQWAYPLAERVAHGWAIEGLEVESFQNETLRMRCITNDSRFREGDLLVLHRGNPSDPHGLHVELQYDGEDELEFTLLRGNPYELSQHTRGWIADQDWFDPSCFYKNALDQAGDSLRGRSRILPLLMGDIQPKIDFARYERAVDYLIQNTHLDESQIQAVALAYATDLLHLIQGPPGTGKTWVLAHIAALLAKEGQRVLITGLTHRAINNALNKIAQLDDRIPLCKIGSARNATDLRADNFENFSESGFDDINGGYIIGATPFSLQTKRLSGVEFDTVIFDEASQVTLPLAIMAMLAGNKYILIGDQQQLPPVSIFSDPESTPPSIFTLLSQQTSSTLLNTTYRLNDVLIEWPSKTFYGGELQASPESAQRRLVLSAAYTPWDFILDPSRPAVFLDLQHRNTTVRSYLEAEKVVELVSALLEHRVPPQEIGVVVPYRAQSRLIRSLLRRNLPVSDWWKEIVADTVERMQGQEREVIIVSLTTSSVNFAVQVADFLLQPQRLNVAVTRPRTKLILLGSQSLIKNPPPSEELAASFNLLRSLLDHCDWFSLPNGIIT
ncbi:MAG: DEAD/DEAH box helicase [Bellilinea sp.]